MVSDEKTITADIDIFYIMKGFEGHTQFHVPGTPTVSTYEAAVERIMAAGGTPRDGLPGKPAEAPTEEVYTCNVCGDPMTFRAGTNKAGKPYKGYFCPRKRCKGEPIWVRD